MALQDPAEMTDDELEIAVNGIPNTFTFEEYQEKKSWWSSLRTEANARAQARSRRGPDRPGIRSHTLHT